VGASKPLVKKQYLLTLPVYPTPDLWGDNEIIQVTLSLEREPLFKQDYTPALALV
jgi:hypothetical protein